MAGASMQSAAIPTALVTRLKNSGKRKAQTCPKLAFNESPSSLKLMSFCGMRSINIVDMTNTSGTDFHYVVASAVGRPWGRVIRRVVSATMFEHYTERATAVISLAQGEAKRLGHVIVGPEQLLLGLVRDGTGIAAKALKSVGVDLEDARVVVEKMVGRVDSVDARESAGFAPRAFRVLELSFDEAQKLGANYIGTEHLLLGLLRDEGVVGRVLVSLGVDSSHLRSEVNRMVEN